MSAANASSLLILRYLRLNRKPFFVSLTNHFSARRILISKPPFCQNPRDHSSLAYAQSPRDNGTGGGRSGGISAPPQFFDDLQKIDVNPPKGTRDFPPEEMRLRNWLFHNFREV